MEPVPKYSTNDTTALELAYFELPKHGYKIQITRAADNDPTAAKGERVECVAVRWKDTKVFRAAGDLLADAITRLVCQIADEESDRASAS